MSIVRDYVLSLASLNGEAVATVRGDAAMLAMWQRDGENVGVVWAALREAGHDEQIITELQHTVKRAIPPWWAEFQPDEKGQSDAFLRRHGEEWAYVTGLERWFKWVGTHWQEDKIRLFQRALQTMLDDVHQEAMEIARELSREAEAMASDPVLGDDDDTNEAKAEAKEAFTRAMAWRRTARRMDAIREHCKTGCAVYHDRMDAGNLLNLANGTLDLDHYTFRPHDRGDLLTHCLPYAYDPAATCPRWLQFMGEVLVNEKDTRTPDPDLITVFQEACGYALTVETRYEAMIWLCGVNAPTNSGGALQNGNAQNGKTTTLNVIDAMLGDLAMPFSPETLTRPDASYYLAGFAGKRVVKAGESKGNAKVAAELLKSLVSGEPIQARPIRGEPITIKPVCKIFWAMNDKPRVDDNSDGFWRRLIVIPFARQFSEEEKDVYLSDKLRAELPGILIWAIEGLKRLRTNGRFTAAVAVRKAVGEYRATQNVIALWLNECTTYALPEADRPATTTPALDAFSDYLRWAKASNRQHTLTSTAFGTELSRFATKTKNSAGVNVYHFGLTTPAVEEGEHWAER